MKTNYLSKKVLPFILAIVLLIQIPVTSLAKEFPVVSLGEDIQFSMLSESSFLVTEDSKESIISISEDESFRVIEIKNPELMESEYIVLNKLENSIYSSISDETIYLENSDISPILYKKDVSYQTKYISYATIRNIVGNVASAASISGAVLSVIPEASVQGISQFLIFFGQLAEVINAFNGGSHDHGIKVDLEITQHYRRRPGGHYLKTSKSVWIRSITKY